MQLNNGALFARYRIIRLLGSGGMGEVYLAEHPTLPRQDALKILGTEISANEEYRQRFIREADLAANLWHANIVRVNDRGEYNEQLWLAMDYVDGSDAATLLRERYPAGMPQGDVAAILTDIASALDHAHQRGLLHRDVKPANILLSNPADENERRILLSDFGIARDITDVSGLTATNMTVATLPYAAPEQLMDDPMDGRADQYSLAATAYHLLTGSTLFPQSNPAAVISRHLNAPPPALAKTHPELANLDPVLARALSKDPAERFTRCTDFAAAFTAATQPGTRNAATAPTMEAPVTRESGVRTSAPPKTSSKASDSRPHWPVTVAALATVLLLAAAVLIVRPWQHEGMPNGTSNSTTSNSVTPSITFDGMRDFITAYYRDLPAHPDSAWTKLDAHCQDQTGHQQFLDFWGTFQSVTLISVNPRDATSVVGRVDYVRRNGQSVTEDRWFRMTSVNGTMLLDESQRIGAAPPPPTSAPSATAPVGTRVINAVAVENGQPANGYLEVFSAPSSSHTTDVWGCQASRAAVAPDIYYCYPNAAAADVCWPSTAETLLCGDDPWTKQLRRVTYTDQLSAVQPPATPMPFALLLDDGIECTLRSGGAWGVRNDGLYAAYGCSGQTGVLEGSATPAIDRSAPLWTVKFGPYSGDQPPPQTRTVITAWFAAN